MGEDADRPAEIPQQHPVADEVIEDNGRDACNRGYSQKDGEGLFCGEAVCDAAAEVVADGDARQDDTNYGGPCVER